VEHSAIQRATMKCADDERHIAIEDNEIFPHAAALVPKDAPARVRREMAQRRRQEPERSWRLN
jgi:hemerythrin-like domain-containing protein